MSGLSNASFHATIRFVVFTAFAAALFAGQATAQQKSITSANDLNAVAQVAQSPDEAAFKDMLVKNSPWNVEWKSTTNTSTGTFGLSFAVDKDGKLSGQFLGDPTKARGTSPGPLKKVALKKNCVDVVNPSDTNFEYCLAGDGTLNGKCEGITGRGNRFACEAVAKPAGR